VLLETRKWRAEFLSKQMLNKNGELAYTKILIFISKAVIIDWGRYIDKFKYERLKKIKICKYFTCINGEGATTGVRQ
jgi:hypothetical protein